MSIHDDIHHLIEEKDAIIFAQATEIAELRKTIASDFMAGVVIEKDAEIAKLKKSFEHSAEANKGWVAAFDKYQRRLKEARRLISTLGWTSSERTDVIQYAEKWLADEEPVINPEWIMLGQDANALPSQDSYNPLNIGPPPP